MRKGGRKGVGQREAPQLKGGITVQSRALSPQALRSHSPPDWRASSQRRAAELN